MSHSRKRKLSIFTNSPDSVTAHSNLMLSDVPKSQQFADISKYTLDEPLRQAIAYDYKQAETILQKCPHLLYDALWVAVAYGNQELAENIIKIHPEWLFKSNTVRDLSLRIIEDVTPFELAYGADDLEMLQMMLPYLDKIENGKKNALIQIHENFFSKSNESKSYDLNPIVAAIDAAGNVKNIREAKAVKEALEKFREHFTSGTIKKGQKHFNIQILIDAYHVYNRHYNDESWNHDQCAIFWQQVINYLHNMVPACYAQAFYQGIYLVAEHSEPLQRYLRLKDVSPPGGCSFSTLGFCCALYGREITPLVPGWNGEEHPMQLGSKLGKLYQTKISELNKLVIDSPEQQVSKLFRA